MNISSQTQSTASAQILVGSLPGSMTYRTLQRQNRQMKGTGGVSEGNRSHGFVPAFRDSRTGAIYRSRFVDGRDAPVHVLDGLPARLVTKKTRSGRVLEISNSVIAGFVFSGCFYTRTEAAKAIVQDI